MMEILPMRQSVHNKLYEVPQIMVQSVDQIFENDENEEEDINI
jgi:hypothetical protein